jgi:hypothetical protein
MGVNNMALYDSPDELISELAIVARLEEIREEKDMTWEQMAVALWDILDDIDASDDMCKEDDKLFRGVVMKLQAKKNHYMYSPDGYELEVTDGVSIRENMTAHAKKELELAGLFDKDSDYEGMLGNAVMELVSTFSKQGHSGMSAALTTDLFRRLANWEALTELTDNPEDWNDISEYQNDKPGWQNTRNSACFSEDGGKTYWNIDDEYYQYVDEDGLVWSGGLTEEEWNNRPMYKSKPYEEKKDEGTV